MKDVKDVKPGPLGLVLLPNRFPALHGLRVFGILTVVQVHVTNVLILGVHLHSPWTRVSQAVWWGMDLFFVLSGFLIGRMLFEDPKHSVRRSGRFWLRRALRILPAYYVVLGILLFAASRGMWAVPIGGETWKELVYLGNYVDWQKGLPVMGWAWSLCVEEHFYLAAPLLLAGLRALPKRVQLPLLLAVFCLGIALRAFAVTRPHASEIVGGFERVYQATHARIDILVAGVVLAFLTVEHGPRIEALAAKKAVRVLWGVFVLVALLWLTVPLGVPPAVFQVVGWGALTSVVWGGTVLTMLYGDGPLRRFFSSRVFVPMATLGYGVYLVHLPCAAVLRPAYLALLRAGVPWIGVWSFAVVASLALAFAVSWGLHLTVEKAALRLRDRWSSPS